VYISVKILTKQQGILSKKEKITKSEKVGIYHFELGELPFAAFANQILSDL
jgi:hypothetical protein